MKAVVKVSDQPYDLQVKEIPLVKRKRGEALVKIKMASICGSDLHMYAGHSGYNWINYPLVLGHEMTGVVEEADDETLLGKRVVVNPYIPCEKCEYCLNGEENLCDSGVYYKEKKAPESLQYGFRRDGGMAEYIVVPEENLLLVPDQVSDEVAAISEALAVGLTAVEKVKNIREKSIVIFGPGPIGLGIASILHGLGAKKIVMVGVPGDEERLETSKELGVDAVVITSDHIIDDLLAIEQGYHALFDCSGHHSVPENATLLLKKGGDIVLVGISTQQFKLQMDQIVRGEINVRGSYGITNRSYKQLLKYATNEKFPFEKLIQFVYPFEESREAFEKALNKGKGKVVLKFNK